MVGLKNGFSHKIIEILIGRTRIINYDSKLIYEGDTLFGVRVKKDYPISKLVIRSTFSQSEYTTYFKDEKSAEEYVFKNKPVFSVDDIKFMTRRKPNEFGAIEIWECDLERLAKKKI